jgi:hypothetical protein
MRPSRAIAVHGLLNMTLVPSELRRAVGWSTAACYWSEDHHSTQISSRATLRVTTLRPRSYHSRARLESVPDDCCEATVLVSHGPRVSVHRLPAALSHELKPSAYGVYLSDEQLVAIDGILKVS